MALALVGPSLVAHIAAAQTPSGQIVLKGHLVPALKNLKPTGPTAGDQALQISIALQPRNADKLKSLLVELNDHASPNYHRYLTSTQYAQAFGRTQSEVQAVESYLRARGLLVTSVAPNNLLINASGSVATVEGAFGVSIANFDLNGRTVYAPTNEPSLPASIGGMVRAIVGLDNVAVARSHAQIGGAGQAARPHATGTGHGSAYSPSDLRSAYDMNSLVGTYSGAGSDIALFELDGYILSDVQTYRSYYGLPALAYDNILVDNATTTPGGAAMEVTLDMEVASAIAPNARQEVYIGLNNSTSILDTYQKIATDNTSKVISTSWGMCEDFAGSSYLLAEDNIFQQYAAQGQALFAASGDSGAYDCQGYPTTLEVDSPASDPNVVGVGGTSLTTGTNQTYGSENVWSNTAQGLGGGGGQSYYFTQPTYQRGPNVINDAMYANGADTREVPDVSANADPNAGYDVYCSATDGSCPNGAGWYMVGGTSAAAPLWASVAIDTNQYLAAQSKPTLGSASAMIYQIFNHPQPYAAYHDITSGSNLYYNAEANYDMASGIGSPDVWNFAQDAAAASAPGAISKTWYFAEGYTGGSFTEYLTLANPNPVAANVTVKYLLQNGSAPVTKTYSVHANGRQTVEVNTELGVGVGVSMVVSSDIGIIAERPIYFTYGSGNISKSVPGGTDVLGATSLGTTFDFGYLDTTTNHDTYLTILNQNSASMTVTAKYYATSGGTPTTVTHTVAANSRGTVYVNAEAGLPSGIYSAVVTLSAPGLVERPMYLVDGTTGYTGSADVIGVQQPSTHWYFAEGFTASTFSERYVLSNPTTSTAHATVTFMKSNGSTVPATVTINPGALQIVQASDYLGTTGVSNSATVTADQTILAERFMSFDYNGSIPGATDVMGATQTGYWFGFAEGYTGGGFAEYLTLQNPDPMQNAYVGITYLPANGAAPTVKVVKIGPLSRYTIYANTDMPSQSFSVVVESGLPIVAERPMYFNYAGTQTGGSDVVGYQLF